MNIDFHKKFLKSYPKLDIKIRKKFDEKLEIFGKNPFDVCLDNHRLKGKYKVYRSIDVTGDSRAWYKEVNDTVIFVVVYTHSNLYK